MVVTHGAKGAWLVLPDRVWRFTSPRIRALNPIGSGDAATAGIAYGIVKGRNIVEAVRLGIACGAANAMPLTPGDVDSRTIRKLARKVFRAPCRRSAQKEIGITGNGKRACNLELTPVI